ncbi:MAG: hypothetical protein WHS88_12310 [Anaerohalosphaeraceae bacterium]
MKMMPGSKVWFWILLGGLVCWVRAEPSPETMKAAVDQIVRLEEEFWMQTAPARLTLMCLGRFAGPEQKKALLESAASAAQKLTEAIEILSEQVSRMENYSGSDWEARYGQTGLWSAAQQMLLRSRCLSTLFLFWSAVCEDTQEKQQRLSRVIEDCRAESSRWQGQEQILEVLALWQRQGADDGEQLRMILHQMMLRDDLSEPVRERMLLLQKRFELFSGGPFEEEITRIFQRKISDKEDFEWAVEYAFLEWAQGRREPLHLVRQAWPSSQEFIAGLLAALDAERFEKVERPAFEAKLQEFAVRLSRSRDPNEREEIERRWIEWIQSMDKSSPVESALRRKAAAGYVYSLLDRPDRQNVDKMIRFLEAEVEKGEPLLGYLYAQALSLKEEYGRAVQVLCDIPADCRNASFDLYILEAFAERLEEYESSDGSLKPLVMKRADQIAACGDALNRGPQRARLVWAQMAASSVQLTPDDEKRLEQYLEEQKDSAAEPILCCRAFRRMQQGQWAQALREWQRVRNAYEPADRAQKERSWSWWRAKYYELYCSARMPNVSSEDIRHAVRILETLYAPPPGVWRTRLEELVR